MKITQVIVIIMFFALYAQEAWSTCRPPDHANINIERSMDAKTASIHFTFEWNDHSRPIGCSSYEAIEFEFLTYTTPDKCFAQPPGGKDENLNVAETKFFKADTDVWNYYFDYETGDILRTLQKYCGKEINPNWAIKADLYDFLYGIDDKVANFGITVQDSLQFEYDVEYEIYYPLEIPDRSECQVDETDDGFVQINMVVMESTCNLGDGHISITGQEGYTCPHLLGFNGCLNYVEPTRYTLQNRLCAPTGGVWEIENPASPSISRGGGMCVDGDGDGYFANVPGYEMFGNKVGDCDDSSIYVTSGDSSSTDIILADPNPNTSQSFFQKLVVVPLVYDTDGIEQFTVTIDNVYGNQEGPCKVRFPVHLKGQEYEPYLLIVDLPACLGTNYGQHSFKVWARDQCENVGDSGDIEFTYVGPQEFWPCDSPSTGQVTLLDYDLEKSELDFSYNVSDPDGVLFSTLNLNSINEDRCKLRSWYQPVNGYTISKTDLNVKYCMVNDSLASASLWAVDRCGNVTMVHEKLVY